MKITREVINDLFPLYMANECSADTRTLVDEYLRENPEMAEEFRKAMDAPIPARAIPTPLPGETRAFRETRRRLRARGFLMGMAIFFSLAPFSISNIDGRVWWCLRDAPGTAAIYASLAAMFWFLYSLNRRRSRGF